ncbi:MAG: tRNA lysidine(34) synthetase TilS [Bdellovibrionia bacterium]
MLQKSAYPRPGEVGGRLIRDVIGFLKRQNIELPITSHILIGLSGGPDSVALAHLLIKYGRRIAPKGGIRLLHVDHGWREKSVEDARFVKAFAKRWDVPLEIKKLKAPAINETYQGRSWEEVARDARKAFFKEAAEKHEAIVLTAHQADDLAETLLWRLFTGASQTHGGGIAVRHGVELRPFLTQRKSTLLKYLKEEKQKYRIDESNLDPRFLRARIRSELVPTVEKIFPKAMEHLVKLGLAAQASVQAPLRAPGQGSGVADEFGQSEVGPEILFQAAGIRGRRPHLEAILNQQSEIDLPGGWKLTRHIESKMDRKRDAPQRATERWTLERKIQSVSRGNGKEK